MNITSTQEDITFMPRRKQARRNAGSSQLNNNNFKTIRIVARNYQNVNCSSGVAQLLVSPANFPTAFAIADSYEMYRVTAMKYRIHPGSVVFTGPVGVSYIPGVVDNAPNTIAGISELDNHAILTNRQTTPTQWVKVARKNLTSYGTWFKTIVGTPDTDVEIQGVLFFVGTSTDVIAFEIELVFEFKDITSTSFTPQVRRQRMILAEKEHLLKVLSYPAAPAAPPGGSTLTSPPSAPPGAM